MGLIMSCNLLCILGEGHNSFELNQIISMTPTMGGVDLQSLYCTRFLCQTCRQMCQLPSEHSTWVKNIEKTIAKTSKWQLCQHACCQTARLPWHKIARGVIIIWYYWAASVLATQHGLPQEPMNLICMTAWRCFASYRTYHVIRSMHWWTNGLRNGYAIQIVERSKQRWLVHVNSITV